MPASKTFIARLEGASVAAQASDIHVLIVGAGRGGMAMLDTLRPYSWVRIEGIADIRSDAPALDAARRAGIPAGTDVQAMLDGFDGDVVIDVTGDPDMRETLDRLARTRRIEVVSGKSARLLFDLARQRIRDERTIHERDAQLAILDHLLEVTEQLRRKPEPRTIIGHSFELIVRNGEIGRGLAVLFDPERNQAEMVVASGIETAKGKTGQLGGCDRFRKACQNLKRNQHIVFPEAPIRLDCLPGKPVFNVMAPLWRQRGLIGVMLFDIPVAHSSTGVAGMLRLAASHLNVALRILDEYETLEQAATLDPLTGAYNRRYLERKLEGEVARCKRTEGSFLSCMFIDLDDFKPINDRFGHAAGDAALRHLTDLIRQNIRSYDTLARYGGDEFVLLMPTGPGENIALAHSAAERIIAQVRQHTVPGYPELRLSISIGMATQSSETVNAESLLARADEALYAAKHAGKNRLRHIMDFKTD